MKATRRDLRLLLPALLAAAAPAQQQRQGRMLESRLYPHESVAYLGDDKKKGRRFFFGANHSGFNIEMHETILGPGTETHAPHKHTHEEIVIVIEGQVEAYHDGKTQTLGPGSVIYFASNQMHSARNVGQTPSRYYVVELRGGE